MTTFYQILRPILLGFIEGNTQQDYILDPAGPSVRYLEFNGTGTIWLHNKNGRFESITMGNAIEAFLRHESIKEIPNPKADVGQPTDQQSAPAASAAAGGS